MKPSSESRLHDRNDMEEILHRELNKLPDQEVPEDFAQGIMHRLAQQTPGPWWKNPLNRWPQGPRLSALMLLSLSAMASMWFLLTMDVELDWTSGLLGDIAWQESLQRTWQQIINHPVLASIPQLLGDIWGQLPSTWISISLIGLGLVACMLTGLGTFLARLLYRQDNAC